MLIDTDTADGGLISFSVPVYMCNDVQWFIVLSLCFSRLVRLYQCTHFNVHCKVLFDSSIAVAFSGVRFILVGDQKVRPSPELEVWSIWLGGYCHLTNSVTRTTHDRAIAKVRGSSLTSQFHMTSLGSTELVLEQSLNSAGQQEGKSAKSDY